MTAEIGSDFELIQDEWLRESDSPPWEVEGEAISYVESGRQALRLAAGALRSQGFDQLFVPRHHCESMTQAFVAEGWTIRLLPVGRDLQVSARTVREHVGPPGRGVILHAPYFGQVEKGDLLEVLADLERGGVPVIVDETHRTAAPTLHAGRIRVASLRKLLPVPDGAYVAGLRSRARRVAASSGAAEIRLEAMIRKSSYIRSGGREPSDHRAMFAAAEDVTDSNLLPARMSTFSSELVRRLDYQRISRQRQENAQAFVAALGASHYTVVAPVGDPGTTPSHIVLSGNEIAGLRAFLASHGVFCPVHWPRPPGIDGEWRTDVISVPVDHRYLPEDMERAAALVSTYLPRTGQESIEQREAR